MENNWKFHHMAVVVRDIDKAIKYYQSLGIATFKPEFMLDSSTYKDYKVYGKAPDTIDKTRMRLVQIGSLQLELVCPIEGEPIYKEFLKSKGEGFHHIAYETDDAKRDIRALQEKGINLIDEEPRQGARNTLIAFLHPRSTANVLTELCEVSQPSRS